MFEKRKEKRQQQDIQERLDRWKRIVRSDESDWSGEIAKMDEREERFGGTHEVEGCCDGDRAKKTYHDTNLSYELIESQVDTNLPSPKVTPLRPQDEGKAKIIEDMLRNLLDRLPFERMNDTTERLCPILGGSFWHVEWNNLKRTHDTVGELDMSVAHPRQVIPQRGIFTGVEDMNHITMRLALTREELESRYDVCLADESEENPEIRGEGEEAVPGLLTQYIVYYRNEKGGIGRFSWVNDTVLEDYEDYQARRLRRCAKCGALEPLDSESMGTPTLDGKHPRGEGQKAYGEDFDGRVAVETKGRGKVTCPFCGGTSFEEREEPYEEVWQPRQSSHGVRIPGAELTETDSGEVDELGLPVMTSVFMPTKIPYYKPDIFPVILQKNVSVFGQLLGDSDVDKIKDQHNTRNRIATKILDKLMKGGSLITLPPDSTLSTDNGELRILRIEGPDEMSCIGVFNLEADIEQDLVMYREFYEEARNIIGITDSFQGRKDSTATSGKAKEFAASQSAGRLESKRAMKDAAYADIFEAMFKFALAYADEPRRVLGMNTNGDVEYDVFDRYDFLERDESGEWYWNDMFLFSCDTAAPLAANREAMWQETRLNLQQGAFGDPAALETLILFWRKMQDLHYPGAAETKKVLEERLAQQQMMMAQQQAAQAAQQQAAVALREEQMAAAAAADILKGGENDGDSKDGKEENTK